MIKLEFLGTGAALNPLRGNTSAYLTVGRSLILIDSGETVFLELAQRQLLDAAEALYIIITHAHCDHIASLPDVIFYAKYISHIPVSILFEETCEHRRCQRIKRIEEFLNFFELYADDDDKPSEHGDYKIISTVNCKSELGLVPALQSIHLIHTEHGHDTERLSPVSVILEDDDSRVFYSGDTSTLDTLHTAEQLYGTMSEVYFEACSMDIESHVSIERLAKEFTPEDRKKITLMHINNDDLVQIATELGFKIATTSRILVSVPRST